MSARSAFVNVIASHAIPRVARVACARKRTSIVRARGRACGTIVRVGRALVAVVEAGGTRVAVGAGAEEGCHQVGTGTTVFTSNPEAIIGLTRASGSKIAILAGAGK